MLLHSLILQCMSAYINFISLKLVTQKSREFRQMKRSVSLRAVRKKYEAVVVMPLT